MTSWWGKTTVIIFYAFVWLFILTNVYQSAVPLSLGYECGAETADEITTIFLEASIRAWCMALVFWALYVENAGVTICNLTTFTLMMAVGCFSFYIVLPELKAIGEGDSECFAFIVSTAPYYLIPMVLATIALFIEKRSVGGTAGETQPLV
eukprot:CAMPEP_0178495696 /NCGR_PEP_ID=MMETSP0696-20121128/13688_1 /TAXON_ID=265572 /ORGANISM="Extubocellulus spinifer, Strain CCMP396" /LENGTH=150 /DNA_ID=CAMNT_0020123863 /DNA_START=198 /DNA_END=650 /DNA_ORIENTATION=+